MSCRSCLPCPGVGPSGLLRRDQRLRACRSRSPWRRVVRSEPTRLGRPGGVDAAGNPRRPALDGHGGASRCGEPDEDRVRGRVARSSVRSRKHFAYSKVSYSGVCKPPLSVSAPVGSVVNYGANLAGVRGNGMASRMCSSLQIHWRRRSMPIPNPACCTLPNRRVSRYHS